MRKVILTLISSWALVGALSARPALAQTLSGRVSESTSGRPLANTVVTLLDLSNRAIVSETTSASGAFRLEAPAVGRYRLMAEHLGFETLITDALSVPADGAAALDLRLEERPILLEGVTAYGNVERQGFEQRRRLRYGTKLGAEDLARRGDLTLSQFIAREDPMLSFRPDRGFVAFSSRFYPYCNPALWIDGKPYRPINPDGPLSLERIPGLYPENIRAIEVYTNGLIPTRYGGGAGTCSLVAVWTMSGFSE